MEIDVLDALGRLVRAVAPTALGLTDQNPIGRLVTGTLTSRGFHKTLQQPRAQTVTALEIPAHAPSTEGQDMGSQIGATHLRTNQKPSHIDHALQMLPALGDIPSNPLIPPFQVQSGAAKTQLPKPAVIGGRQIAQLSADQPAVLQRVLADHQVLPTLRTSLRL